MIVKSYFKRFDRSVKAHMMANLRVAGLFYLDQIRILLSTPGPPRSEPYNPPHREFDRLIAAYTAEFDRPSLTARVGAGMINREGGRGKAPIGRYLEYGALRGTFGVILMRPHIRPALFDNMQEIGRRIVRPMT